MEVFLLIVTEPSERHQRDAIKLRVHELQLPILLASKVFIYLGVSYSIDLSIYNYDYNSLTLYIKAG